MGLGSTSDVEATTLSEKRVCRAPDLDDVSSAAGSAWEEAAGKHAGSSAAGELSFLMQDQSLCRVLLPHQQVLRVLTVLCVVSWACRLAQHVQSAGALKKLHATPITMP